MTMITKNKRRIYHLASLAVAAWLGVTTPASAASINVDGVLANSGEQGETLARFGDGNTRRSIGLVYDGQGSLWSSGIDREIVRYTLDGRQLATYSTPEFGSPHLTDNFTLCGDTLILKINKKLYRLPLSAEPGAEATPLDVPATQLAPHSLDGWVYAALEDRVFRVNPEGSTEEVGHADGEISGLEVGPEGKLYLRTRGEMLRRQQIIRMDAPETPHTTPGARPHWVNGMWFGFDGHGTVRRFNSQFKPDPGVVLGGNSGSFIGYVPGNYEIGFPRSIAWLGGHQYAVGGISGVVHLLQWSPKEQRFTIARRIGPLKKCDALALDHQGRIWFRGGVLQWNDGPDTPVEHGVPGTGAEGGPEPFAAAVLPGGEVFVAPLIAERGSATLCAGKMTGPAQRHPSDLIKKEYCAAAAVTLNRRPALVMTDASGVGIALAVNRGNGKPEGQLASVILESKPPVEGITSLTSNGEERLWAGVSGRVIEYQLIDNRWEEQRRWDIPGAKELHLAWGQGRLWVADAENHRVLVCDAENGAILAQIGTPGKPGSDLATFHAPKAIAANGERAVVFDSGNQRLVKLRWQE